MLVIGVDPGLTRCGYCCVEGGRGSQRALAAGVIRTPKAAPRSVRLAELQQEIIRLFEEYPPDVVAVEQVFFQANVRTAVGVAQAAGVVMAEAANAGAEVVEHSPTEVKMAVCGYGRADKEQVSRMVQTLLALPERLKLADISDAAAVALCCLANNPGASVAAQAGRAGQAARAAPAAPTGRVAPAGSPSVLSP